MAKWIKDCRICNDGLCIRFEELKRDGHTDRQIAEIMHKEAYQAYPELKDDFSAEKIRNRYRYHMKKELGEFHPPADTKEIPHQERPTCKKCGNSPVKGKWAHDETGKGTKVPIDHGLCFWCLTKDLNRKGNAKAKLEVGQTTEWFEEIPINAEVENNWMAIIPKIEGLIVDKELKGRVSEETRMRIEGVWALLECSFRAVLEDSENPECG